MRFLRLLLERFRSWFRPTNMINYFTTRTFMERALAGEIPIDQLEEALADAIDAWHEGGSGKKLHEFLGLTWAEYLCWVQDESYIERIVERRVMKR